MRNAHIFVYFILYLPTYDLYIQLYIVRALRTLWKFKLYTSCNLFAHTVEF